MDSPFSTFSDRAVSLTDQLLTDKQTCWMLCWMLCGLCAAAPLGVHRLALLSLSSAAVVSPGSGRCWMVAAPPLLVGFSGVQCGSSWTSAVASPRAPSLGLDLWVSRVAPAVSMGLQTQVSLLDSRCCSRRCWRRLARCLRRCGCSLHAD